MRGAGIRYKRPQVDVTGYAFIGNADHQVVAVIVIEIADRKRGSKQVAVFCSILNDAQVLVPELVARTGQSHGQFPIDDVDGSSTRNAGNRFAWYSHSEVVISIVVEVGGLK